MNNWRYADLKMYISMQHKCFRGYQTVLGYAPDKREILLTNHCQVFGLSDIMGIMSMEIRSVPWGYQHRKTNADNYKIDRARVEDKKIKGKPTKFFCRSLYCPERGAFLCLKTSSMGLGTGYCDSCKIKELRNTSVFKLRQIKLLRMQEVWFLNHSLSANFWGLTGISRLKMLTLNPQ